MDPFYLGFVFVSLLSFVVLTYVFVTFPCGTLGQVWHLIVSFLIFAPFTIL